MEMIMKNILLLGKFKTFQRSLKKKSRLNIHLETGFSLKFCLYVIIAVGNVVLTGSFWNNFQISEHVECVGPYFENSVQTSFMKITPTLKHKFLFVFLTVEKIKIKVSFFPCYN